MLRNEKKKFITIVLAHLYSLNINCCVNVCVCMSQDIKAGEVRNIKSLWENKGETSQDKLHGKVHHLTPHIIKH